MAAYRGLADYDRKRALVIDDDPDMGALVGLVLSCEGYEVDFAYDGHQGLQRFSEAQPDVVLLDVMMPGLDGWSVLAHMHSTSPVPVVIVTASRGAADERLGRTLGAADFITKPFRPRDLASRVARVTA